MANRRDFIKGLGVSAALLAWPEQNRAAETAQELHSPLPEQDVILISDEGWRMWPDRQAQWKDDVIYLPEDVHLDRLPVNQPSGGWEALNGQRGIPLSLPATVEQYFWGIDGFRPYHNEYKFEASDPEVSNGSYLGVSWWWRPIEIPRAFAGRRILLHIRGARQRAEVYLNRKLVGYSILEELPFTCDLTDAAVPGGANQLAIRITNPGGEMDWRDTGLLRWGAVEFQRSHGFGGLDRALRISAHGPVRVEASWVLNTPEPHKVAVFASICNSSPHAAAGTVHFSIAHPRGGQVLASADRPVQVPAGGSTQVSAGITAPDAELWEPDSPHLYLMRAEWKPEQGGIADSRTVRFGFRWFAPEGVGTNAIFRLNGRRIKIYTAISWGFWGLNGLWPTPELARREVERAQAFHLNCLNFHRNLGKQEVLDLQDEHGLLRNMEPGGGIQAVASVRPNPDRQFAERYMQAKIVHMIREFRSHPSLLIYTLQNEASLDLENPNLARVFKMMRAEDPSRTIVGNDGFVARSGQAWMEPYSSELLTSRQGGAGGWWDDHTGPFSDVWNDQYYQSPGRFLYRSTDRAEIVEWGEMKGAASPDNHALLIQQIEEHGGKSYDLRDHRQILAAYETFLDQYGFRKAFPTAGKLFESISRRAYESWGEFMENIRISDVVDYSAISGWESTAIENHSGLVDNMRDFKSDPLPISKALLPIRPVAKQRRLVLETGDRAAFDIYLLNDTSSPAAGRLQFTLTAPDGGAVRLGEFPAPEQKPEQFSYLVRETVETPPLKQPGVWRTRLTLNQQNESAHECELWVVDPNPHSFAGLRVAVSGPKAILERLRAVKGVEAFYFPGEKADVVVVAPEVPANSEVSPDDKAAYARLKAAEAAPAELDPAILSELRQGTPLLVLAPVDGAADSYARQLAHAGAFDYQGMVGPQRASWMGSWYFVREHPLYSGMPVNIGMSIHYQVKGSGSNGWRISGKDIEIIAAYSRDHDRHIGAGTLAGKLGRGRFVMQRVSGMHPVFERRFLANALAWLSGAK